MQHDLQSLSSLLRRGRFLLRDESLVQSDIGEFLNRHQVYHDREVVLSSRDRIDFMVSEIGIEVKLKGGKLAILRQIERYAEHECVKALILITAKTMSLPSSINGKPALVIALGAAWL